MNNSQSHLAPPHAVLTNTIAASPQIQVRDLPAIAAAGFTAVMNNRPDGESMDQPSSEELRVAAQALGIEYHYCPVDGFNYPGDKLAEIAAVFADTEKPVFAFCRSGTRSANLWINTRPAEEQDAARRHAQELGFDISMSLSVR